MAFYSCALILSLLSSCSLRAADLVSYPSLLASYRTALLAVNSSIDTVLSFSFHRGAFVSARYLHTCWPFSGWVKCIKCQWGESGLRHAKLQEGCLTCELVELVPSYIHFRTSVGSKNFPQCLGSSDFFFFCLCGNLSRGKWPAHINHGSFMHEWFITW